MVEVALHSLLVGATSDWMPERSRLELLRALEIDDSCFRVPRVRL